MRLLEGAGLGDCGQNALDLEHPGQFAELLLGQFDSLVNARLSDILKSQCAGAFRAESRGRDDF